ncbi:MAG TPA: DUF420 domain-containing protein [Candidatus Methylomirabilis sp.]|nr:DUF420 domain-containing protein [Candidatus Methylomirabilis sp.]
MPLRIEDLPSLNAALNGTSALLLLCGYLCIRRKRVVAHRACMVSAFVVSTLFLVSYLTLRYYAGMTRFTGEGWIRPAYFTLLLSHTVLAAGVVPLALVTLSRAIRGRFDSHVRIARWTLPIWMYVSVTGVLVYWILYHLYPRT